MPRESNEDGEGKDETGEAAQVAAPIDSDGLGNVPGHADSVDDDRPTVSNGGTSTSGRVGGAGLVDFEKALTNGETGTEGAGGTVHPGNRGDELGDVVAGPGTDKELRARGAESGGGEAEGVGAEQVKSRGEQSPQKPVSKGAVSKNVLTLPTTKKGRRSLVSKMRAAKKTKELRALLTSEQGDGEQSAEWLKNILPTSENGWWEVRSEGKGFAVKFRWRVAGEQHTLTFPRISSAQYKTLKEAGNDAHRIIGDSVAGHIDDCAHVPAKRDKARSVATRLGIDFADDQAAGYGS